MPGVMRRGTVQPKKQVIAEEEEAKEKIKFDIFNNVEEEESPDYKKKTTLEHVRSSFLSIQDDVIEKPVMLKTNKTAKKYEFFEDDD